MSAGLPFMAQDIVTRKIDELLPYARNAKIHSREQVIQLAAMIAEYGYTNPVFTWFDPDSGITKIIAGHGRILALEHLGIEDVPTIKLDHLTEVQARAYIIADNRSAESPWDTEMLALELEALEEEKFDLTLTGFDTAFLKSMQKEVAESTPLTGSKDAEELDFENERMEHRCPRCGFEFDDTTE
mgnify:CR=1 FL=1